MQKRRPSKGGDECIHLNKRTRRELLDRPYNTEALADGPSLLEQARPQAAGLAVGSQGLGCTIWFSHHSLHYNYILVWPSERPSSRRSRSSKAKSLNVTMTTLFFMSRT